MHLRAECLLFAAVKLTSQQSAGRYVPERSYVGVDFRDGEELLLDESLGLRTECFLLF